jgi:hypothetical protein
VSSAKAPVGQYAVSFSSKPVVVNGNFQKTKKDAASIPHAIRNTNQKQSKNFPKKSEGLSICI